MQKKLQHWCPEIFTGLYIDRHNDDAVFVAPCCQASGEILPLDQFDFFESQYLNSLRDDFLQDIKPSACHACWQAEDAGHKSRRQSAIEFYTAEENTQVRLQGLDINATWACNLACVMCGAPASSTWAKELNIGQSELRLIGRHHRKNNTVGEKFRYDGLKKIHFNGGEPLLNNEHLVFLQKSRSAGSLSNLFVSYNTNGTVFPDKQTIDLWSEARLVKLFFSIDATQTAFNYIRWPAIWDDVANNMLRMKAELPSNVMFGFNVTVGAYNLFEIKAVKDWFDVNLSTNREGDISDFNWQPAKNFDPSWLPWEIKQDVIARLPYGLESVCNYVKSTKHHSSCDTWITKLEEIDKRRGTDWKQSLYVGRYYS